MEKSINIKFTLITVTTILTSLAVLATILVPGFSMNIFSNRYGHLMNHQVYMLLLAVAVIGITVMLNGTESLKLLTMRKLDSPIIPVPLLGIKPKKNEGWKSIGTQMAVMITVITAVVIYFQLAAGTSITLDPSLLLVIPLAAFNAFSEEIIYRFGVVATGLKHGINPAIIAITSGVIFGVSHYFGAPGGIPGILMAGFLGWFLAKSMCETKGFFWAFVIHFLQDVVIFFAILQTTL